MIPNSNQPTTTILISSHRDHLVSEGFTDHIIDRIVSEGLVKSLTPDEAYKHGFAVAIDRVPTTGGLCFSFSPTLKQLRVDDNSKLPKKANGKQVKYLSTAGDIGEGCAYIPLDCRVITEGMKDALAGTYIGCIPTGALAGVNHAVKALPKSCGYINLYDADVLINPKIFLALIKAGVHCGGRVAIVPTVEGEPNAGLVEWFKSGATPDDYHKLLDNALTPEELYHQWFDSQIVDSVGTAARIAEEACKILGALYGYASVRSKGEIKALRNSPKFCEWALDLNSLYRCSGNTKQPTSGDDGEDFTDPVKVCIDIVKDRGILFHSKSPECIAYVSISDKNGIYTTHTVDSTEFKLWLVGEYFHDHEVGIKSELWSTVVCTVEAIAIYDSPEKTVSMKRIATQDGYCYMHLADDKQTVIKYSGDGWDICTNPPVNFVFDRNKSPLPIPLKNKKIDELWSFVRVDNTGDRLAVLSVVVKALVPGGTEPLLAFIGYKDSGKTTSANYIRALIDPFEKVKTLSKLPDSIDNFIIHAMKRVIVSFDNVSHISASESDFLCTVATGGGHSKRKHYSNSEEIIHDVQNVVIMTGIGNIITKPDLLDRAIVIGLERIGSINRSSETKLSRDFDLKHSSFLGALLDVTVAALKHRDTTDAPKYTRMVEFAHLGEGIEAYLGYPVNTLNQRMVDGSEIANDVAIDSSPVGSILRNWINTQKDWKGTLSELLNVLKIYAKKSGTDNTLPKTANTLGGELKKIESALNQAGILVQDYREPRNLDSNQIKKKHIYLSMVGKTLEPIVSPPTSSSIKENSSDRSPNNSSELVEEVFYTTKDDDFKEVDEI